MTQPDAYELMDGFFKHWKKLERKGIVGELGTMERYAVDNAITWLCQHYDVRRLEQNGQG